MGPKETVTQEEPFIASSSEEEDEGSSDEQEEDSSEEEQEQDKESEPSVRLLPPRVETKPKLSMELKSASILQQPSSEEEEDSSEGEEEQHRESELSARLLPVNVASIVQESSSEKEDSSEEEEEEQHRDHKVETKPKSSMELKSTYTLALRSLEDKEEDSTEEEDSSETEQGQREKTEPSVHPPSKKVEKKPTGRNTLGAAKGSQIQPELSEYRSNTESSDSVLKRTRHTRSQPSVTPARSTTNTANENSPPTNDSRRVKRKLFHHEAFDAQVEEGIPHMKESRVEPKKLFQHKASDPPVEEGIPKMDMQKSRVEPNKLFQHKASDPPVEEGIPKMDMQKSRVEPKKLFQRVWSQDDEITVLKGMVKYWEEKGANPCNNQEAFHGFIKESLNGNFSKSQLTDKIRRLKKKYENNVKRGKNGEDPKFSNGHEKNAFELSKKIWTTEGTRGGAEQAKPNISNSVQPYLKANVLPPSLNSNEAAELEKLRGISGLNEDVLEKGLQLIGASKMEELKKRLNNLQELAILEDYVIRTQLIYAQAKLIWDAYKTSNP